MKISELITCIENDQLQDKLVNLYGITQYPMQKERYLSCLEEAKRIYRDEEAMLFSSPGRFEIGGNHTDHQLGAVLCATSSIDMIAVVIPTSDNVVRYCAKGFNVNPVDLNDLEKKEEEINTSEALIRGIASCFKQKGYAIGGFSCYAQSDVLPGSGISSSACFEVLVGTIFNHLFNNATIDVVDIAKIGQYAENEYFGKPSGLLDQMACAYGGFTYIDFKNPEDLIIEGIQFDLEKAGYSLVLTNCGGSHADLGDEYSAIVKEMKQIANHFGEDVLSKVAVDDVLNAGASLREAYGDRAIQRALHFFQETMRADQEKEALKQNDFKRFIDLVNQSGHSSWELLQNVTLKGSDHDQPLSLALAISKQLLEKDEACRVHGGGFAGTILAIVKHDNVSNYIYVMNAFFGKGSAKPIAIRNEGGIQIK